MEEKNILGKLTRKFIYRNILGKRVLISNDFQYGEKLLH